MYFLHLCSSLNKLRLLSTEINAENQVFSRKFNSLADTFIV